MITKQTIYFWNIFFSRRSIWVLLELVRRWTQHFTKIDQEKRINWTKLHLKPHDYRILLCKHWFTSLVWNFCLWVADVRFLLAKRLQRRGESAVFAGCLLDYCISSIVFPKQPWKLTSAQFSPFTTSKMVPSQTHSFLRTEGAKSMQLIFSGFVGKMSFCSVANWPTR